MSAETIGYDVLDSPVGELLLTRNDTGIREIRYLRPGVDGADDEWRRDRAGLRELVRQLRAYFAGELRDFDLDLAPVGTPFQRQVWSKLLEIRYGETWSYGELARAVGRPAAARAVGAANGRNPISIVVPCHRVIGSDGKLTGYGGGLPNKRRLLALERETALSQGRLVP